MSKLQLGVLITEDDIDVMAIQKHFLSLGIKWTETVSPVGMTINEPEWRYTLEVEGIGLDKSWSIFKRSYSRMEVWKWALSKIT